MWMQELTSLNFEPLRPVWPELANMGGYAEHYAHSDPESALVKLRSFAVQAVDHIYRKLKLQRAPQSNFVDLLSNASFRQVATDLPLDKFHLLRKLGNRAAHGDGVLVDDARHGVREAWQLARWLHVTFPGDQPTDIADFKVPPAEGMHCKAEFKRKAKALAIENSIKEKRLRQANLKLSELHATEGFGRPIQGPVDPAPVSDGVV